MGRFEVANYRPIAVHQHRAKAIVQHSVNAVEVVERQSSTRVRGCVYQHCGAGGVAAYTLRKKILFFLGREEGVGAVGRRVCLDNTERSKRVVHKRVGRVGEQVQRVAGRRVSIDRDQCGERCGDIQADPGVVRGAL